jgi:hypothetical protein
LLHATCCTARVHGAQRTGARRGEGTGVVAVTGIGVARVVAAVRALILVVLKELQSKCMHDRAYK